MNYDLLSKAPTRVPEAVTAFYVRRIYGYIADDFPPTSCPVCGAIETKFSLESSKAA